MSTTTITITSTEVFNGVGANFPFATVYSVPNPAFDADAPRNLDSGAFNPAAVTVFKGKGKDWALGIIRKAYAGQGKVTVVWPNGKTQSVRTFEVAK